MPEFVPERAKLQKSFNTRTA